MRRSFLGCRITDKGDRLQAYMPLMHSMILCFVSSEISGQGTLDLFIACLIAQEHRVPRKMHCIGAHV